MVFLNNKVRKYNDTAVTTLHSMKILKTILSPKKI